EICAEHHQFAVREIEHPADAVDQHISAGDQRVDRAEDENVDRELQTNCPRELESGCRRWGDAELRAPTGSSSFHLIGFPILHAGNLIAVPLVDPVVEAGAEVVVFGPLDGST